MYRTIQKLSGFESENLNLSETSIFKENISFSDDDLSYPSLEEYLYNKREIYDSFLKSIEKYTLKLKNGKGNRGYKIGRKALNSFRTKLKVPISKNLVRFRWINSPKNKIIKKFFEYAGEYRHCNRLVEKTPHHYLHVHQILWTFPNASVIWMIRHPIDIITSSVKRSKIDSNYGHYWNVEKFVREFKGSFRMYDFYKKMFGERLILVKYEDFVSNSKNELKEICHKIDEPFLEGALNLKKDQKINWKPDPHISTEIVVKTEKNWHDHLSLEDAKSIETELNDLMKKYDFSSYSNFD